LTAIRSIDGQPTAGSNPMIDTLVFGGAWGTGNGGTVKLTYSFKTGTDPYAVVNNGLQWSNFEKQAFKSVFDAWSAVAKITFTEKSSSTGADLWYWKGVAKDFTENELAFHELPEGDQQILPLYGVFNSDAFNWKDAALQKGGNAYLTILHEIGHGLGLAHPHADNLGEEAFPGVTQPFDSFGNDALNQSIFTVMSYNDGWKTRFPRHDDVTFGNALTPMAFDIAAVQLIYGAKANNTGSNTYYLPGANKAGIGWACIWDTGGYDRIAAANTTTPAIIDLRDASLFGPNGGGYVSWHRGIVGGFTIANTVTIEAASGGRGNDKLTGNSSANALYGKDGHDKIYGREGDDTLIGGLGNDTLSGSSGVDTVSYASAGRDVKLDLSRSSAQNTGVGYDTLIGIERVISGTGNDTLIGNGGSNRFDGGAGNDRLYGRDGDDSFVWGAGNDQYFGGADTDTVSFSSNTSALRIDLELTVAQTAARSSGSDLFSSVENITGGTSNDVISGSRVANILIGGAGNDTLNGRDGADRLTGGTGSDSFVFNKTISTSNVDRIMDFGNGTDRIVLDNAIFSGLASGALEEGRLAFNVAVDSDDFIIFDQITGVLSFDPDGNGAETAIRFAVLDSRGFDGTLLADDFLVA
jgi:serralysin